MTNTQRIDSRTREGFSECESPACIEIAGRSFFRETFSRISVGPCMPPVDRIRLIDTEFRNCAVDPGEFSFRGGVELCRVEFDTVLSRDSLTISTDAALDHVVVKGKLKRGGLWIRPDEAINPEKARLRNLWRREVSESISLHVDFSELDSRHTEVIGLPVKKLRYHPERHIAVQLQWAKFIEISRLERFGFLTSCLRRLKTFESDEGVFSAPPKSSELYPGLLRDAEVLRSVGIELIPG